MFSFNHSLEKLQPEFSEIKEMNDRSPWGRQPNRLSLRCNCFLSSWMYSFSNISMGRPASHRQLWVASTYPRIGSYYDRFVCMARPRPDTICTLGWAIHCTIPVSYKKSRILYSDSWVIVVLAMAMVLPSDHSHPLESTLVTSEWSVYLARNIPTGNHHAKRFSSVHSRPTLTW